MEETRSKQVNACKFDCVCMFVHRSPRPCRVMQASRQEGAAMGNDGEEEGRGGFAEEPLPRPRVNGEEEATVPRSPAAAWGVALEASWGRDPSRKPWL